MTKTSSAPAASPSPRRAPSRLSRILLPIVILVLPVTAMLWMALGRSPKPVDELNDGTVTRRATPQQAVDYALPNASYPISTLTLPDGRTVSAQAGLPLDRDQNQIYIFSLITTLVGRDAQQQFFPLEDFARRLARSAVDAPRHYLPSSVWPVQPTPQRFLVETDAAGQLRPSTANAARYRPLVDLFTSLDTAALVQAYVQAYPLLQKAYASLGHNYASYYFNDALVNAVDDLLATPQPDGPLVLLAPQAGQPHVDMDRPWVSYRYADARLEALSPGQKAMLRIGRENANQVKAKLTEIRALLVSGQGAPAAPR